MADKEMGAAERELRKATGVRDKNFKKRQDYLAALAKGCDKLADDDFDQLTDDASNWANAALESLKAKESIADFTEGEEEEDETEEEKPKKGKKASKDDDEDEKPSKKSKAAKDDDEDDEDEKAAKKGKDGTKRKSPRDYVGAKRDKFGLVLGTKVSDAVKLFEKGATMKTIKDKTGGPQNNILRKLSKDGHLVERFDNLIKVTHKDDLDSKQKAKVTKANNKKAAADEDEDEDDKPAKKGKDTSSKKASKDDDEDEDDKPAKKSKKASKDDDEDEAPAKSKKGKKAKDDDDEEEKPSKKGKKRVRDDDDE